MSQPCPREVVVRSCRVLVRRQHGSKHLRFQGPIILWRQPIRNSSHVPIQFTVSLPAPASRCQRWALTERPRVPEPTRRLHNCQTTFRLPHPRCSIALLLTCRPNTVGCPPTGAGTQLFSVVRWGAPDFKRPAKMARGHPSFFLLSPAVALALHFFFLPFTFS